MHPRKSPPSIILVASLLTVLFQPLSSRADNLITTSSQGAGANWGQAIWKTNNTGTAVVPVPGNTYTVLSNSTAFGNNTGSARVRNPVTNATSTVTFPGDSLTLGANTEIRAKNITSPAAITGPTLNFPGTNGNPGLILNGGLLNAGDDGVFGFGGVIQVAGQSYICTGDNGGGGTLRTARGVNISGQLTGSGTMVIFQGTTNTAQTVSGTSNTFTGQWIIKAGRLVGTAPNSLGTNTITCDPFWTLPVPPFSTAAPVVDIPGPAVLEPNYTMNSAGMLILTNGGKMRLHQEVCFTGAIIEGTVLSPGTHYFGDLPGVPGLGTLFPSNFDPGGSGAIVVQAFGTPPPLPPSILTQPMSQKANVGSTTRFSVVASDNGFPPLTYQWRKNGVNLTDSANISGSTNSVLVIKNVSASDAPGPYDVVVGNASFQVTSLAVTLQLVGQIGEAYEAAVLAANPVAFYELNELGDPSTNQSPVYDLVGGYIGTYGANVQNGNTKFNIYGPQPSNNNLPGFSPANTAALFSQGIPDSRISVLPWNLNTNTVTLTAWINPNGGQLGNEGIIYCRGGTTVAGLDYSPNGYLGYNWNNEQPAYGWDSGLIPPSGQWSLVALVVTPTNATIYVLNTLGIAAAVHTYSHISQAFEGTTLIGDDSFDANTGSRSFSGVIDDVAVFNRALSPSDLLALFSAASGIASFPPAIGVQPASLNLYAGQTAQFTGLAVGTAALSYQWKAGPIGSGNYVNLTDNGQISGSTTPILTISNITAANSLDYVVSVINSAGSTLSTPASLNVQATSAAENITMSVQQAAGFDWDNALYPNNWSDNLAASDSAAAKPGSTYDVLPGARLRSPQNPLLATFPGTILRLDGDGVWNVNPPTNSTVGELRFKQPTYGVLNGTVNFNKLVMNGGQLDVGNDGLLIIGGEIDILANAPFNNDSGNDRGYRINAWLTGNASIEYHGYNANFNAAFTNNLNIAGTSNTFSGSWNVVAGVLLGSAPNSLGTNNIIVGPQGALETTYNINSSNANLVLNGKMFLHQTDTFRSALISGKSLAPGTYSFATLNSNYPAMFPATWKAQNGANFSSGSGSLIVLSNAGPFITVQPVSVTFWGQENAQFTVTALGNTNLSYQWLAGPIGSGIFTNLFDGGNISGSATNTLNITNLVAANGLDYRVVVTNLFGSVTSRVATLNIRPGPTITVQPITQTAYVNETIQLSVATLGLTPLSYRWQAGASGSGVFGNLNNNGHISGATTATLTIANLTLADALDYQVIVSNAGGSVTSSVATLTILPIAAAENITMTVQQASNNYWDTAADWSDLLAASESARSKPGSTYELLPGARMRTPPGAVLTNFPGNILTVDGSGVFVNNNDTTLAEIRFKHANPGTVFFKKLVMNGGQLDTGDNGLLILTGEIDILTNTPIYADNAAGQDRGYQISSWLTGTGNIEYHDFDGTFNSGGGLNIAGSSNTYSGTWTVVQGALLGSGPNSLGTNSITVGVSNSIAALETLYNLNCPSANLLIDANGQVFLHANDTFHTVTINTATGPVQLNGGTYSFAYLSSHFPANFPASWSQQTGSSVSTGSGSLTVLYPVVIPPDVTIQFARSGAGFTLTWSQGTLLQATNVTGPWSPVSGATSPYLVTPSGPRAFYRVQVQ